jgi:hypothetical protein
VTARRGLDLETLLNDLTRAAFAVLIGWSIVGIYGTLGGYLEVNRPATLRLLLAVLVLVFAHHVWLRVREHRLQHLTPDERYGFTGGVPGVVTGPQQSDG